jgi:hypothetical protein
MDPTNSDSAHVQSAMRGTSPNSKRSLFLDSLSPEVRLRIYEEVLRSEYSLLKANPEYPDEVR